MEGRPGCRRWWGARHDAGRRAGKTGASEEWKEEAAGRRRSARRQRLAILNLWMGWMVCVRYNWVSRVLSSVLVPRVLKPHCRAGEFGGC